MSIVPVHPLQLPNQVPAYGTWESHGNNRWGPTLDARGLGAGQIAILQPQRASVHGNTNTVIGIAEVKSTLVSTDNGYEGLGLYVSALKRDGEVITEVWNNNLLQSGNKDHWLSGMPNDWSRGHIVVHIPYQYTPDFIDTGWVVRGTSGSVSFDSVSLQDYFVDVFTTSITDTGWDTFQSELGYGVFGGRDVWLQVRYIDTYPNVRISKGQRVTIDIDAYIIEAKATVVPIAQGTEPQPVKSLYGFVFKMLKSDGTHDWINPGLEETTNKWQPAIGESGFNYPFSISREFIAKEAYHQVEVLAIMFPFYDPAVVGIHSLFISVGSLDIKVSANDLALSGTT